MPARLPAILLVLVVLLLSARVVQAFEIALISEQRGGVHTELSESLLRGADAAQLRMVAAGTPGNGLDESVLQNAALIVAAGFSAAEAALAHSSDTPVMVVLISRSQALGLLRQHPQRHITAIVLDQPIERQLALIRATLPDATRIGALFGPQTSDRIDGFRLKVEADGRRASVAMISSSGELNRTLERVLPDTDAFLALPEPLLNSSTAARAILLSSYRHRRPVFAYSRAYVEAGALAAVFSTPGDIARDTLSLLEAARSGSMPRPGLHAPERFDVAINAQVARALNIDIPSPGTLLERMRSLEKQRGNP